MISVQENITWRLQWLWYLCGFSILLLIAILSLTPMPDVPVGNDKLGHFIAYMVVSSWFSLIAKRTSSLWWVMLGLIAYGLLIEFLQGLTDYRMEDLADALANSLGVVTGLICHFTRLRQWLIKLDERLAGFL